MSEPARVAPLGEDCRIAIIIPACNEEASIGEVLREIQRVLPGVPIAVGINASTDRTAELCREAGVIFGETANRGYGHGCVTAVAALETAGLPVDAYVFVAADGANDPRDIPGLRARAELGFDLVLGTRTRTMANLRVITIFHFLSNCLLGFWASLLSGKNYSDLGPLRLIRRAAFQTLQMRELGYGWTIEPQVAAPKLGLAVCEIPVRERPRLAGAQKVSGVSIQRDARIGLAIMAAGLRSWFRCHFRKP